MAEKPALNPETPRRRPGRPSRKEELQRALAELGVDPATIDPRRILAAIAGDSSAPAGARVAACRALMAARDPERSEDSAVAGDAVSVRAQQLLAARRRAN
jgi:hypothetical protein